MVVVSDLISKADVLPLHSRTPLAWGRAVLADPVPLLADHAFLEKKAAQNAMELLTRWPGEWLPGWVETMTGIARDEAAHLSQVVRLLTRRGGRLGRSHSNPYASQLRALVRLGGQDEIIDRLFASALIELRSCERFSVLATCAAEMEGAEDLAALYKALFSSELGHFKVFLKAAHRTAGGGVRRKLASIPVEFRWQEMLAAEAKILEGQAVGPRIHSGVPA